jgi:peptidoglycan/xylan/chitin deacetylase (PgdA/CDA1 family)
MRRACKFAVVGSGFKLSIRLLFGLGLSVGLDLGLAQAQACDKPVYLTFDTGHMAVTPLVADVLKRQEIAVTFFLANEATKTGGGSLDDEWQPQWQAWANEGHAFGSHTFDHVYWLADLPDGRFRVRASAGPEKGRVRVFTAAQYCESLNKVNDRFEAMTGQRLMPLFRAAGGKTSAALIDAARQCGYSHVGWSAAGFLGDELPSDRFPNQRLLEQALRNIRSGDVLVAHLGIWSRQDPWAPAVLEPLIVGLKGKGFCFKTLADHPLFGAVTKQGLNSSVGAR